MGSQITKIPSICGDSYPGVGYQVDDGEAVRVAMAWPSASAGGWRSLTMEVPKKLSLETELKGVSVETLLKAAGQLFGDNDLDGFKQLEQMLGDKLPSAVARAFARYAPVDSTHAGSAEKCRCEIEQFLGEDIPELDLEGMDNTSGKIQAVLVPVGFDPVAIEIDGTRDIMSHVGGIIDEASGYLPPDALQPVVSGLPSSLLFGNIVIAGFNPETGEDKSLSAGELMDAMNYFQRDSPRGSGREVALIVQNGLYGELRKSLSHEPSAREDKDLDNASESLDEMMEQKVEVAGNSELDEDLGVSNEER